jgi:hypothetical protein
VKIFTRQQAVDNKARKGKTRMKGVDFDAELLLIY